MTVKELIKELLECPMDAEILVVHAYGGYYDTATEVSAHADDNNNIVYIELERRNRWQELLYVTGAGQ